LLRKHYAGAQMPFYQPAFKWDERGSSPGDLRSIDNQRRKMLPRPRFGLVSNSPDEMNYG